MNKIKMACLTSLLVTGITQAAPCDGFTIKVTNSLADDIVVTTNKLVGATIQPGKYFVIDSGSTQVFTINGSTAGEILPGKLSFKTESVPFKTINIQYDLDNTADVCKHTDQIQPSDYSVKNTLSTNKEAEYIISNE